MEKNASQSLELDIKEMTDEEVKAYLVETARSLSVLALDAGEAEASALLSVAAAKLTGSSEAA